MRYISFTVSMPAPTPTWMVLIFTHQSPNMTSAGLVASSWSPACWSKRNQKKEPNLFIRNTGVLDILQCGSPLLAARSAVQHLLIMANHRKNWHFLGAQLAHIRFHAAKETDPIKNASYANLVVYWLEENCHWCSTWQSGQWITSERGSQLS